MSKFATKGTTKACPPRKNWDFRSSEIDFDIDVKSRLHVKPHFLQIFQVILLKKILGGGGGGGELPPKLPLRLDSACIQSREVLQNGDNTYIIILTLSQGTNSSAV